MESRTESYADELTDLHEDPPECACVLGNPRFWRYSRYTNESTQFIAKNASATDLLIGSPSNDGSNGNSADVAM